MSSLSTTTGYHNVSWDNVNNMTGVINNMNTSAGGYLFAAIQILVFFVLFITLTTSFGWEAALLSSSFVAIILGMLFAYMGVMSWTYVMLFVGLLIVAIMYIMWSNRNN